jgi:hypothetical protein
MLLLAYPFIVFGLFCAVIASLERIFGRPIPRLRYCPQVRRNRVFAVVPFAMIVLFSWMVFLMISQPLNMDLRGIIDLTISAGGVSGVIGWIIFAFTLITTSGFRLIGRLFSN